MARHEVRIDADKALREEPATGHNRWHPDIEPVLRCRSGDEVVLHTRDAVDGQVRPDSTAADLSALDTRVVHPLTGPVYVEGAEPGDLLEVEILDVAAGTFGFTLQVPGLGFLSRHFAEPFLARWDLRDGWATSEQIPGVRVPGRPFMGTMGLSPGHDRLRETVRRERAAVDGGERVALPDPAGAVPAGTAAAADGLRTLPPREQGGNIDIKQLTRGARLFLPVDTPGALFSAGDAHFSQGDGESCGLAIEMRAALHARLHVHPGRGAGGAASMHLITPEDSRRSDAGYLATTGMSVDGEGRIRPGDISCAAENALLAMIDQLGERYGYTRQQAYAICSVAVDLRISELVNMPSVVVSAVLPLDIFTG